MEALCRPLLEYGDADEDESLPPRAFRIDAGAPDCKCEGCSLSPNGRVGPAEILLRFVVSPLHVKKGKPKPSCLTSAEKDGMSSFRDTLVTDAELLERAQVLVTKARENHPDAGVFGVFRFPAAHVKALLPEGAASPAYCMYDIPDGGVDSHVDVYQRVNGSIDELRVARRQGLFKLVAPTFEPVALFRGGLLTPLAPL